jgi:hypothetical protein
LTSPEENLKAVLIPQTRFDYNITLLLMYIFFIRIHRNVYNNCNLATITTHDLSYVKVPKLPIPRPLNVKRIILQRIDNSASSSVSPPPPQSNPFI